MKKIGKIGITALFSIMMIMALVPTQNERVNADVGDTIAATFPDPEMASQIATLLGKTVNDTLDFNDIAITNTLYLGGNITDISGIEVFINLQILSISGTQITTVPNSFAQLTNLADLDLQHNQITSLPDNFGDMGSLESLDLNSNKLTTLPDSISYLPYLRYLNLSSNEFSTLPLSLVSLTDLTDLYALENQITDLPIEVYNHNVGNKLFGDQSYQAVLADGIVQADYTFDALPIYEQVPTYGDGSEFIYSLVLPDGSEVQITPVIVGGKVTIDKAMLTQAGEYTFKASIFTGHLDPSEYTQTFTLMEATPTPAPTPTPGGTGDNSSVPTGQSETMTSYLTLLVLSLGAFGLLKVKHQ